MRATRLLSLPAVVLAASLAGAADEPAWQEPDPMPMPPGSPADQALWREARDVNRAVPTARHEANRLQLRVRTEELSRRLGDAAKADPSAAPRLEVLRKRLADAQVAALDVYTSRWPVDVTRVCQVPFVDLTSAMNAADPALIAEARDRTARCVELGRTAALRQERANAALAEVVAESEKALPPLAPAAADPGGNH
jgi:hypothetical protein